MSDAFSPHEVAEVFKPLRLSGRPIFRQDRAEYTMFYAPGCLCVAARPEADRLETIIVSLAAPLGPQSGDEQGIWGKWARELCLRADLAVAERNCQREDAFTPECLTLYMNNECNLRCTYCHTDPSPKLAARLDLEAIAAAGEAVAESCRRKGVPFSIVFHGGGEPTLHRQQVDSAMARLEALASIRGIATFRYVATNGVMSEEKARWLAGRFDLVGLSCDGPPEIQNHQRPRWGGGSTARVVERTGHVLREEGCRYHVRTTITAATLSRMAEIVAFLCQQFKPEEIRLEPVYVGGRTGPVAGLVAHQADEFVTNFLEARQIARKHRVLLMTSGSRPGSIHGPYCHVFRHVVNLVPGGLATACFKITQAAQVKGKGAVMGGLNEDTGRFEIDPLRVQVLRQELDVTLPECAVCFNRYHCARECPDWCPLDDKSCLPYDFLKPGFRCQAQKVLAYSTLIEAAGRLWSEALAKRAEGNGREPGGDSRRIICGTTQL
jgi:uncharacterized protein